MQGSRSPPLYRYFPSKTHLFVNVMLSDIAKMSHNLERLASTHVHEPTEHDVVVLRLLRQQWFAIVQSCLSGLVTLQRAEFDVRLACELLLMPLSSVQRESSVE